MKTKPAYEDRDVVYMLAVRTRRRYQPAPWQEDAVRTALMMAGRFCESIGVEADLARSQLSREAPKFDGYQVYTPAEYAEIAEVIERIDARYRAREAAREKGLATRRAAKAVPA